MHMLVRFFHLEDSGTGKFANDGLSMFSLRFSIMFQLCFKYGFAVMENHEIIHSKFQKACSLFFSFARPSKKQRHTITYRVIIIKTKSTFIQTMQI